MNPAGMAVTVHNAPDRSITKNRGGATITRLEAAASSGEARRFAQLTS
jgi:hypothetical protein